MRILTVMLCAALFGCASGSSDEARKNTAKQYEKDPWYTHNKEIASGFSVPLDKGYDQFTDEERFELRKDYPWLLFNDHPPYPVKGLAEVLRRFNEEISYVEYKDKGDFIGLAKVSAEGKVTEMNIQKSPSNRVSYAMARAIMATNFKPAICQGTPCAMSFYVSIHVTRE